jgi:hypothetical protein
MSGHVSGGESLTHVVKVVKVVKLVKLVCLLLKISATCSTDDLLCNGCCFELAVVVILCGNA